MLREYRLDAQSACKDDERCRAMRQYDRPPSGICRDQCRARSGACDHRLDAALAKFPAMVRSCAAIGVNDLGLLKRAATYTGNRHHGIDERQQLDDVVLFAPARMALARTPFASTRMLCWDLVASDPWG